MQIGTLGLQSAVVPPSAQFGRAAISIDLENINWFCKCSSVVRG